MDLKEEQFLEALRIMWRESSPKRITISEDMLKRARAALIVATNSLEQQRIEMHKRVAWKVKNEIMRYDLTNSLWQEIEVDGNGVRLLSSNTMFEEFKNYKESEFAKKSTPVLFKRHINVKEQIVPATKFDDNILDYYFENMTNITDNRAIPYAKRYAKHSGSEASQDNKSKIMIAKVALITMFIPDIPHFLLGIIGFPGAWKTTQIKNMKELVDPTISDVHSPYISQKDIHNKFAQNYLVCFDNVRVFPKWLSDLCSAVVSGTAVELRELFTNEGIVTMILKSCICIGSINRVITEKDAVTRLLNQELLEIDSEEYSKSESELQEEFERIKPELLGYILSIISKAIGLRKKNHGKYKLGRMADVLEWGEAISQACGYKEEEFLTVYRKLATIQEKLSATAVPLADCYSKLFYRIFNSDSQSFEKERELGYKKYEYNELQETLNDIAEGEGYRTRGKDKDEENIWPRNSRDLAEHTRIIASRLRRTSDILIEVREDADKNNEFIIGYTENVENYINTEEKKSEFSNTVVEEFVLILKERKGELMKLEDLSQEASDRNKDIDAYLEKKFILEGNWKLRSILLKLKEIPGVQMVYKNPYTFTWIDDKDRDRKDNIPIDIPRYNTSVASEAHFNESFSINESEVRPVPNLESKPFDNEKYATDSSDVLRLANGGQSETRLEENQFTDSSDVIYLGISAHSKQNDSKLQDRLSQFIKSISSSSDESNSQGGPPRTSCKI